MNISLRRLAWLSLFTGLSGQVPAIPAQTIASTPRLAAGESMGRALGLSAAHNLRDIGGYRTTDGHVVVRGRIYRSDMLNPLSTDDQERFSSLGIMQDYDLRTAAEIESRPDMLPQGITWVGFDVLADGAPASMSGLGALRDPATARDSLGGGRIERIFEDLYRAFITLPSANKAYHDLFSALADSSKGPVVFHCTTGKDRTGWAAAALLTLLGVPRKTVMADYLKSNENIIPFYSRTIDRFVQAGGDRQLLEAIYGVKRQYLEASFAEMRKSYGSIEGYFSKGLGIDAASQQALRNLYLEK